MKDLRSKLDELSVKVEGVHNLAEILEDYFYMSPLQTKDNDFRKHVVLSSTVVEKIDEIDKFIDKIWDFIKENK